MKTWTPCLLFALILGDVDALGRAVSDRRVPAVEAAVRLQDPKELSLDELIARLPDADFESLVADDGTWILHPIAEEFERRLGSGVVLEEEQWIRALEASGVLRSRSLWPADMPFAVGISVPSWLMDTSIEVVAVGLDWQRAEMVLPVFMCGEGASAFEYAGRYQVLGPIEEGEHELTFRVTLEGGKDWSGLLTRRVKVVPRAEDVLRPFDEPAFRDALRSALRVHLGGGEKPWLYLNWSLDRAAAPAGLGIGLAIEWVHAGELRAATSAKLTRYDFLSGLGGDEPLTGGARIQVARPADPTGWTVVVRGDARACLRDWAATSYWSGSFEVSLAEILGVPSAGR